MPRKHPLLPKCLPCRAKSSRTGKPCKKRAMIGGVVCDTHGGQAPQVKKAAAERTRDMLADAMDPERVLREVGRVAYSDIRDLFDERGNVLPIKQWPEDIARAVAGVEVVKRNVDSGDGKIDDVIKLKLWDKVSKLTNLMKHHGQLVEQVDVTIGSKADRIIAARARVDGKR